jgi:hypothetical protein
MGLSINQPQSPGETPMANDNAGPSITLILSHQEAEDLKELADGTALADRITNLQGEAVQAMKRKEEAKRNSRARTNQNRKQRLEQLRADAAELKRLREQGVAQ